MLTWLVIAALGVLLILMLVAPLESLRWWSQRGFDQTRSTFGAVPEQVTPEASAGGATALEAVVPPSSGLEHPDAAAHPEHYVIYLSGIGVVDGNALADHERDSLMLAVERLPRVRFLADVFPYAVDNRGLLQRTTSWLWRRLENLRVHRSSAVAPVLINLRNTSQVMVASDPRYGPTYAAGIAHQVLASLERAGRSRTSDVPVTLIGYSGGAQIAIAAAPLLALADVPVSVIAIGGVFGDDPGLDAVEHLWDIRGRKDILRRIGPVFFPGRWPMARGTAWQRIREDGRLTVVDAGPVFHDGSKGYFGAADNDGDGRSNGAELADILVDLLDRPSTGGAPA